METLVTRHNRKTDPKEEGCAGQNVAVNTLILKICWLVDRLRCTKNVGLRIGQIGIVL